MIKYSGMKSNRLFAVVQIAVAVVVGGVFLFTVALMEPLLKFHELLFGKHMILLGIVYFFLFLAFRLVAYYYREMNERADRMRKLHDTFVRIASHLKINELTTEILSQLISFYHAGKGVLLITDPGLKRYVVNDTFSLQTEVGPKKHHRSFQYQSFSPGKIPPELEGKVKGLIDEYELSAFPLVVVIPFFSNGDTKAIGILGTNETEPGFLDEIKDVINIFLRQVVMLFDNSLLHEAVQEASITDPLTGLYNRRYFQARMEEVWQVDLGPSARTPDCAMHVKCIGRRVRWPAGCFLSCKEFYRSFPILFV